MTTIIDARENRLLAALTNDEWARWGPLLEAVNLKIGEVLYESGGRMSHLNFPTNSIISLLC